MTARVDGQLDAVLSLPLAGVTVLDLTTFLSGPSATQLLADLGAEVIKLEPPTGDSSRTIPPYFIGGESAYFLASNRNKRSIVVDLKHSDGLALVKRLIERVDVVIENFRPGVCDRLGLDKHTITEAQPGLVWASISGFGQFGPNSGRPAYDMVVQAMSGVMSLTGHEGGPAARLGIPAGDVIAGMYAAIGVLAALVSRSANGAGRVIDVSMLDGLVSQLSYQAVYSLISGTAPGRQGAGHDSIPTYRTFTGSDGQEFVVTANTQRMWTALCAVINRTELSSDPRFLNEASRLRHREELWHLLEGAFAEATASEWVGRLVAGGVPTAPVLDVSDALELVRESGRGTIVRLEDDNGTGRFEAIATPILFEATEEQPNRYPPLLGQHTFEVLCDVLGVSEVDCRRLEEEGVVATADAYDRRRDR